MYIKNIYLSRFKPFDFSGIEDISIHFPSPITIIMGTNGSGKSSLLRELTPLPASRPDYHKNGSKVIEIIHDDELYVLSTDFSNKTSPHSFKKEGKELNTSGTTKVQEELIVKYLGYTLDIHKTTHMEIDVCHMSPSERKNYFIQTNSIDLSFILTKYKKVVSKIKECKSNLAHLYARKSDIESKLLTSENYTTLITRNEQLTQLSLDIDKLLYTLELHIEQLQQQLSTLPSDYPQDLLSQINTFVKDVFSKLPSLSKVDRNTYNTQETIIQTQLTQYTQNLKELDTELKNICGELEEIHKKIESCTIIEPKTLEMQILEFDKLIENIKLSSQYYILPNYTSDKEELDRLVQELKEYLFTLIDKENIKLWSIEQYRKGDEVLKKLKYELTTLQNQYTQWNDQYTRLCKESTDIVAPIPEDCINDTCKVRASLLSKLQLIKIDIKDIESKLHTTHKRITCLKKKIEKLSEKLSIQYPYIKSIYHLKRIHNESNLLSRVIPNDIYENYIRVSPLSILKYIEDTIRNTELYILQQEYISKKTQLQIELDKIKISTNLSLEYLQKQQEHILKRRDALLVKYTTIENEILQKTYELNMISEYSTLRNELMQYNTLFTNYVQYTILKGSIQYHTQLLMQYTQKKQEILSELATIQHTLKEQKSLQDRYTEEILKHIKIYEKQLKDYTQLESALSPNSGIPHQYTVRYINSLIHNVKYFTSQIFTYPLIVESLPENSSIDFNFPAYVKDVYIKDINRLSKGQREVINFSWALSVLYQLNILNRYPIVLDEIGTGFDPVHAQKFIECIYALIEQKYVSQIFLVNHGSIVSSGFIHADVVCLRSENVLLPEVYNTTTQITKK